jgi:DNA invertase Pin-like site-specific DNA recombinase
MGKRLVAYYRVSTQRQGESGLGLEGQKNCVEMYAKNSAAEIVKVFTEIESGKKADRPQLANAIAHARRTKATLIIAKLDRLARNVHFLSGLMQAGVDFVACDNPSANKLTVHILAAVAEAEAEAISARTKTALQAYKARGGVLGSARSECRSNLNEAAAAKGRALAAKARKMKADEAYTDLYPILAALRAEGKSLQMIADQINSEGYTTRR